MKGYHIVSGVLFALVGGMHLVRAVRGWQMNLGANEIPVSASYAVFGLCTVMAIWAFRSMKKA